MNARAGLLVGLLLGAAGLPASEGAAWLKIPQGARSVALGTAVSSFDRGAEAQWSNPAALARVRGADLSLSRQAWLGQTRDDFAALALAVPGGGVGAYANWLGDQDVYRDLNGVEGGSFSNNAWATGLGAGLRFGFLSLGVSGKVIQERLESKQYAGYASDWGAQARLGPWLRLGGSVQNLGAWSGDNSLGAVDLPLTYRGGLALQDLVPGLTLSLEGRALPRSQEGTALAGAEYGFSRGLFSAALRAGYEASAVNLGDGAGLSLGAGAQLQGLKVDFAWSPYGALGSPYRMTLGWDFGSDPSAPQAVRASQPDLPQSLALGPLLQLEGAPEGGLERRLAAAADSLRRGDAAGAESQYQALCDDYSANPRPYHGLFLALYRQGKQAQAAAALEQKLLRAPDAAESAWLKRYRDGL